MADEPRKFLSLPGLTLYDQRLKAWTEARIPTALSDLTDDLGSNPTHTHSQYLTATDIQGKADLSELALVATTGSYNDLQNLPTIPTAVSELTNDAGYLTAHQDISGKANIADLAPVATSGSYNDLTDKPFGEVDESINIVLKPAVFSGTNESGAQPIPLNEVLTTGSCDGLRVGDFYNVTYAGEVYENLEVKSKTLELQGSPASFIYIGNLDSLFLRSNLCPRLSDDSRVTLSDSDLPFLVLGSPQAAFEPDGAEDISATDFIYAFFSPDLDQSLTLTPVAAPSDSFTVELDSTYLSLAEPKYYFFPQLVGEVIETYQIEEGKVQTLSVNGTEYTGVWQFEDLDKDGWHRFGVLALDGYSEESQENWPIVFALELNSEPGHNDPSLAGLFKASALDISETVSFPQTTIRQIDRKFIPAPSWNEITDKPLTSTLVSAGDVNFVYEYKNYRTYWSSTDPYDLQPSGLGCKLVSFDSTLDSPLAQIKSFENSRITIAFTDSGSTYTYIGTPYLVRDATYEDNEIRWALGLPELLSMESAEVQEELIPPVDQANFPFGLEVITQVTDNPEDRYCQTLCLVLDNPASGRDVPYSIYSSRLDIAISFETESSTKIEKKYLPEISWYDIAHKPDIYELIPTNLSEFNNDVGYITLEDVPESSEVDEITEMEINSLFGL